MRRYVIKRVKDNKYLEVDQWNKGEKWHKKAEKASIFGFKAEAVCWLDTGNPSEKVVPVEVTVEEIK